jgi:hypothetical protein
MKRTCFGGFSMVADVFVLLATPLLAEFAYVANSNTHNVSYRIGKKGVLTTVDGSLFPTGGISLTVDVLGLFGSPYQSAPVRMSWRRKKPR